MPGRNDACPCGSGKKYKKCCLESDKGRKRSAAAAELFEDRYFEAIDSVHREAIRCNGVTVIKEWSKPFQGGNELEMDMFKSFVACHVPFQGASSLAHWVLNHGRLEESEREILIPSLGVPFSLLVMDEVASGVATFRDMLTGEIEEAGLAERLAGCQPGQVQYGKILTWQGSRFLHSPGPVRLEEDAAAEFVAEEVMGGREALTPLELIEPEVQAELYSTWCSTVRWVTEGSEREDDDLEEPPVFPDHHRLYYVFEPGVQSQVVKALGAASAFTHDDPQRFHYPGEGQPEAVLHLGSDTLTVYATRVARIEELQQALESALGEVASLQEHQTVNLMAHVLEHGLHRPIFPGLRAMSEALSPAELEMVEQALGTLS